MEMNPCFRVLDPYLIWGYRLSGHAGLDFVIGTTVLVFLSQLLGEVTAYLAQMAVRRRLDESSAAAERYRNLSVDALKAGNKEAYLAANRLANEAFGQVFFMQIAQGASFLWPIFFALTWMQYRFLSLPFPIPLTGYSLGYIGVFILLYIPVYFFFRKVKRRLTLFGCRELMPAASDQNGPAPGTGTGLLTQPIQAGQGRSTERD